MPDLLTTDDLIARKEAYDLEAKAAQGRDGQGKVPNSVWETYSAFANTAGGVILLGVDESADGDLSVLGLGDPDRVRREFWDGVNNDQIVSANVLSNSDVEVHAAESDSGPVSIVVVRVPRAPRLLRPVHVGSNPMTGTYRRYHEGDYKCKPDAVRRLIADAEQESRDDRILPGFGVDDLSADSITAYRNLFRAAKPGHPWLTLDDVPLLTKLKGWRRDRATGEEGLTLAGLLMFGRMETILDEVGDFLLDYQEQPSPGDDPDRRWVDRVTLDGTWSGNLFDFYRLVYPKLVADLKVPFRVEDGHRRVDETHVHEALREALVNAIVHADYAASSAIRVVRQPGRFSFRNPGGLRIPLDLALEGGHSDGRNRGLQKMFQMIGEGEQAGSGVPKIFRAWKEQHWRRPIFEEVAVPEHVEVSLPMVSLFPEWALEELDQRFGAAFHTMRETERLAVATALVEGQVTNRRLQDLTPIHPTEITQVLRGLVEAGYLVPDGKSGSGRYYTLALPRGDAPPLASDIELTVGHASGSSSPTESLTGTDGSPTESPTETGESLTGTDPDQLPLFSEEDERLVAIATPIKGRKLPRGIVAETIVRLAGVRKLTRKEIAALIGKSRRTVDEYVAELVASGELAPTEESESSPNQAYVAASAGGSEAAP